jgi:hypothetical protein
MKLRHAHRPVLLVFLLLRAMPSGLNLPAAFVLFEIQIPIAAHFNENSSITVLFLCAIQVRIGLWWKKMLISYGATCTKENPPEITYGA